MVEPLATLDDVAALLPAIDLDLVQVDLLLGIASDAIRVALSQTITLVTNEVFVTDLTPRAQQRVFLPELPVISVSSVSVDGVPVSSDAYRLDLAMGALEFSNTCWWTFTSSNGFTPRLSVTYTHGYAEVPRDIVGVCLEMIRRSISAVDNSGIKSERADAYQVVYDQTAAGMLTDAELATLYLRRQPVIA